MKNDKVLLTKTSMLIELGASKTSKHQTFYSKNMFIMLMFYVFNNYLNFLSTSVIYLFLSFI